MTLAVASTLRGTAAMIIQEWNRSRRREFQNGSQLSPTRSRAINAVVNP
jgi:hypothetical protein